MTNGWISVFDPQKPASGEEVLTLSYAGDFPAPEDMFADPGDRAYCLCTYFYPGDRDENEVPPVPGSPDLIFRPVTFEEAGFYELSLGAGPKPTFRWRRVKTIEEEKMGIVCWKPLDYPTPD